MAWGLKFGAPLLGLSIVTSIVVVVVLATVVPATSRALAAIPLPALIGVHAIRIVGFLFLLLLATGRLSAPFATSAGWGDIIAGATAVPVAWALSARGAGVRWLVLVWNSFGLLDLLAAVTLGMTSAPGSPLQLFFDPPGSTAMATLPWAIIPVFLVPQLIVSHLAIYRRLGRSADSLWHTGSVAKAAANGVRRASSRTKRRFADAARVAWRHRAPAEEARAWVTTPTRSSLEPDSPAW